LSLVVDSELFRIEAIVRWLDATDARLKRLPPRTANEAPASTPRVGRKIAGIRR
jgi:hypothetical protein